MLDAFVEAKKGVICGIKGNRYINSSNNNRKIWHIDANNLYGGARMQPIRTSSTMPHL